MGSAAWTVRPRGAGRLLALGKSVSSHVKCTHVSLSPRILDLVAVTQGPLAQSHTASGNPGQGSFLAEFKLMVPALQEPPWT